MRYLTVPDVLWINTQVTGTPQAYQYATLEEATFYQYSPGQSQDLARQAARFLQGFHRLGPFAEGNEATAFAGVFVFLAMNGQTIELSDDEARTWLERQWERQLDDLAADVTARLRAVAQHDDQPVEDAARATPDCDALFTQVTERFPGILQTLSARTEPVA